MSTINFVIVPKVSDSKKACITNVYSDVVKLDPIDANTVNLAPCIHSVPEGTNLDVSLTKVSSNDYLKALFGEVIPKENLELVLTIKNFRELINVIEKDHFPCIEVTYDQETNTITHLSLVVQSSIIPWSEYDEACKNAPETTVVSEEYLLDSIVNAENLIENNDGSEGGLKAMGVDITKEIENAGKALTLKENLETITKVLLPNHRDLDEALATIILANMFQDEVHGIYSGDYRGPSLSLPELERLATDKTLLDVLAEKISEGETLDVIRD